MFRKSLVVAFVIAAGLVPALVGQVNNFVPVTDQMLLNPSPDDWLMFSRTYDAQRYSPLNQVNKQTVNQLGLAWSRGIGQGQTETIPTVYKGVMYVNVPGGVIEALDATNGDLIWSYQRPGPNADANAAPRGGRGGGGAPQTASAAYSQARSKTLA